MADVKNRRAVGQGRDMASVVAIRENPVGLFVERLQREQGIWVRHGREEIDLDDAELRRGTEESAGYC